MLDLTINSLISIALMICGVVTKEANWFIAAGIFSLAANLIAMKL